MVSEPLKAQLGNRSDFSGAKRRRLLERITNGLSRVAKSPANAVSLLQCMLDMRTLNGKSNTKDLVGFCHRYAIRPRQVPEELVRLFDTVSMLRPKNALEIGTCTGGTLFMTCRVADPGATVISVDLPGGRFGRGYVWPRKLVYRQFAKQNQVLHLLRKNSHDPATLASVRWLLRNRQLDFLFIDGDHTYDGVRKDFEMYAQLVRKGGIIAFHDIVRHPPHVECEVDRFWNEIRHSFKYEEIIKDAGQGWAGIGILYV